MTTAVPVIGSAAHAKQITHGRHPGVQTAMAWLAFSHLPEPLQSLARPLYLAAMALLERIPNDSAELTTALNELVGAKDWTVRAGIRSDQGDPGPVPRPAEVVDPPSRFETANEIVPGSVRLNRSEYESRPIDNRIGPNFGRPIQDRPQA